MFKRGRVISVITGKSKTEKLEILLDNSETETLCAIAPVSGNTGSVRNCLSCTGCSAGKNRSGLFAVTGNKITALNKTGKIFRPGDVVAVIVEPGKVKLQAFFSIFIPLFLAVVCAVVFYSFFKTEIAGIGGVFFGMLLGAVSAILIKNFLGEKMLAEATDLSDSRRTVSS